MLGARNNTMGVAENIKKRMERGLSQQELADKLGYKTRSTITKIETEKILCLKNG